MPLWHLKMAGALGAALALALLGLRGPAPAARSADEMGAPPWVESVEPAAVQPLAAAPETIWYDDFDSAAPLRARYFEYDNNGGDCVPTSAERYGARGQSLRARFRKGAVGAGGVKVVFGDAPVGRPVRRGEKFQDIYWRLYVKHQRGWSGNPAKLSRATVLADSRWAQAMIAHVWGGKGDGLAIDPATGIQDDRLVTTKYNDFAHLRWLGNATGPYPIFSTAASGKWVCVEAHARLNAPGQADGVFALWIDGKLQVSRSGLDWVGSWNERGINAVFLENYWNAGSPRDQERYFDNFVIATRPIGPITAEVPPRVTRSSGRPSAWELQAAADPLGRRIAWRSAPIPGERREVRIDAANGAFAGGTAALPAGRTCWLRIRWRSEEEWSPWSDWHHPFRTAPSPGGGAGIRFRAP